MCMHVRVVRTRGRCVDTFITPKSTRSGGRQSENLNTNGLRPGTFTRQQHMRHACESKVRTVEPKHRDSDVSTLIKEQQRQSSMATVRASGEQQHAQPLGK